MKMDARKQKILLALITDFIETADPVGSRTIARKYNLGVSPATIRNELADLEEMGYIEQPHTSSGRVPSHKGYRYYVDFLMEKHSLSKWEESIIHDGYEEKLKDVTHAVQKTGSILSEVTGCAAVIIAPRPAAGTLKHLQLISLNPGKAMLVVVSDTGVVQHQAITVPETLLQEDLDVISRVFNAKLQGKSPEIIRINLLKEVYFELFKHKNILDVALQLLGDSKSGSGEEKIYLGGVFNILNQPEFNNVEKVKILLSLLEHDELLCQLLESGFQAPGVQIRIGDELLRDEMRECSLISANYQVEGNQGAIGVLGPTRMNYARIISVVEYLADNLSQVLEKLVHNG